MRSHTGFLALVLAILLVVGLAVAGNTSVNPADLSRLCAKFRTGEQITDTDLQQVAALAAIYPGKIDVEKFTQRARRQRAGLDDGRRPPRVGPLDDYQFSVTQYNWVDISELGTAITWQWGDDENQGPFDLGFTFNYFGTDFTQMNICSNGWISPTSTNTNRAFDCPYPAPFGPTNGIFPYESDLLPNGGGTVYYYADAANSRFIVSWVGVPFWAQAGTSNTFEVILYANGDIVYEYQAVETPNDGAGIGIQNNDGTLGLNAFCEGAGDFTPDAETALLINQPDGFPNPITGATGNWIPGDNTVVFAWTDPTQDTNGNPITVDSVEIRLRGIHQAWVTGAGVTTYTLTNPSVGNNNYSLHPVNAGYTGPGTRVSVVVGTPSYVADFEADPGMWETDGTVWEWGAPTAPNGPAEAHSGTNVWAVGLTQDFPQNACATLEMNPGLTVQSPTATLEFWAWYILQNQWSPQASVTVYSSIDDGATWEPVPSADYDFQNGDWNNCAPTTAPSWCKDTGEDNWHYITMDLGALQGMTPRFRFEFGSTQWVWPHGGFFIDDMMLWGLDLPTWGPVSGTVTLDGGTGNVAQAEVRANGVAGALGSMVHPAADGTYLIDAQVGYRRIAVSLPGYVTTVRTDSVHLDGLTNYNFNVRRNPPPTPLNFQAQIIDAQLGTVHAGWNWSTDPLVDEYYLVRKMRDDSVWVLAQTIIGRLNTLADDTLTVGGIWQYAVCAVDTNASTPVISMRSDSMEVMFGEIPPHHARLNGAFDDRVRLTWYSPSALPEWEVGHDDGTNEIVGLGWRGWTPQYGWMVARFESFNHTPVDVTRLKVFLTDSATLGDNYQVGLFPDSTLTGWPSHMILTSLDATVEAPLNAWKEFTLDPPVNIPDGVFYVGIRQMAPRAICLGGDSNATFVRSTFYGDDWGGWWNSFENYGWMQVPMLRAWVIGQMGDEVVPMTMRGAVLPGVPAHAAQSQWGAALTRPAEGRTDPTLVRQAMMTGKANQTLAESRRQVDRYYSAPAYFTQNVTPVVSDRRHPSPLDEMTHYVIYRDGERYNEVAGNITTFDDFVPEGVSHSYNVRASYAPFVVDSLSVPTNTVTGVAAMPPAAPDSVVGLTQNATQIRIQWTAPTTNNDMTPLVDLAGYQIFRDNELIGTVNGATTLQYLDTPPFPNHVYRWTVKAMDEVPNVGPGRSWTGSVINIWTEEAFRWIELADTGIAAPIIDDWDMSGILDIGFPFEFYGDTHTQLRIAPSGYVSFDLVTTWSNTWPWDIPDMGQPNDGIYPFWTFLAPSRGGQILYYSDVPNGRFIVEWNNIIQGNTNNTYSFELVMTSNGAIYLEYMLAPLQTDNPFIVGVENGTGTQALKLCRLYQQMWPDYIMTDSLFIPSDSSAVSIFGPIPEYGSVDGHITLDGGAGVVTAVSVAGTGATHPVVNPDAAGNFHMDQVQTGVRRFTASLDGYFTTRRQDSVNTAGITGIDLTLRRLNPPPVTNFNATSVNAANATTTLSWDVSPDPSVDGYRIYMKNRNDATWTLHRTVRGRLTNTKIDTLTANGFWRFQMTAIDTNVLGDPSESDRSRWKEVGYGDLPPFGLTANGNFDNHIVLNWLDPMTPQETEVSYDDGDAEQSIGYQWGQPQIGWYLSHFQSVYNDTITVTELKVYFTNQAMLGANIQVGVFGDNGEGLPVDEPLAVIDAVVEEPLDAFRSWVLDTPVEIPDGSFFIGARQMDNGQTGFLGLGSDNDVFHRHTYYVKEWQWNPWQTFEQYNTMWTTPMLRAYVRGAMYAGMTTELAPAPVQPARWPVATVPTSKLAASAKSDNSMVRNSIVRTSNKASQLTPPKGVDTKTWDMMTEVRHVSATASQVHNQKYRQTHMATNVAVTPLTGGKLSATQSNGRHGANPLDLDFFYIYRDGVLVGNVPGTTHTYSDAAVVENHPYAYYVTAHYENGHESPHSNELTGIMCNMAPAAPINFSGSPVGNSSMRLTWTDPVVNSDGSPLTDLTSLRIFRDGVPIGNPVAPGVQTYLDNVPEPTDQYVWEIKAADDVDNLSLPASYIGSVQPPWMVVPYGWVDIVDLGSNTGCAGTAQTDDDIWCGPFELGFDFPYFGQTYHQVWVSANGWLTFSQNALCVGRQSYFNDSIPSVAIPNCSLYPFWDDLSPENGGGAIMYYGDNTQFVVSYLNVPHFNATPGTSYTFQVILDPRGVVRFNYQDITGDPNSCTVGVETCAGDSAIQLAFNGAGAFVPASQTAVAFWGGHPASIQGTVTAFGTNRPVANCKVYVQDSPTPDTTFTDAMGLYSLGVEPGGPYSIVFTHETHCDTTQVVPEVVIGPPAPLDMVVRTPYGNVEESSLTLGPVWQGHEAYATLHITAPDSSQCPLNYTVSDTTAWLTERPASGHVDPGQSVEITLTASTVGLPAYATLHSRVFVRFNAVGGTGNGVSIPLDLVIPTDPEHNTVLPTVFALHQNYPNPFNPTTLLRFDVPKESRVDLVIYNVMGQEVAHPVSDIYQAGRYNLTFDATNLPSGMYLVRMNAGEFSSVGKMMLLK
jgi:hypothetical protein